LTGCMQVMILPENALEFFSIELVIEQLSG